MKKLLSLTLILLVSATSIFAQHTMDPNKKRASPHETMTGNNIKITYGRPYVKGRDVFSDNGIAPFGKVWRLGADEATEITVAKDCMFAGKPLKAGTYTMFAIPNKTEWTIILNSQLQQWGSFGYDKVKDKDVLTAKVPVRNHNDVTEEFTISNTPVGIKLDWNKTSVEIPVNF
jgi:hypothetical protein